MKELKDYRSTRLEVNLDHLRYNIGILKEKIKDSKWICVVKADFYGAGIRHTYKILEESGVDMFACATINEAIELRDLGTDLDILLLGYTSPDHYPYIIEHDLSANIFSLEDARALARLAKENNTRAKIHLSVDTGMTRLGFRPDDRAVEEIKEISKLENIQICGIFSHYYQSEEKDRSASLKQVEIFTDFVAKLEDANISLGIKHMSNSAAVDTMDDYRFDAVRSAFLPLGYHTDPWLKDISPVKPTLELKTKITRIQVVPKGTTISYNARYTTHKDQTVIATLPIGYADGYPRCLTNKGQVFINGKMCPIRGSICMDQMMVELDRVEASVGDEVVLFGYQDGGPSLEDLANLAGTINSEISTTVSRRIPRVYLENGQVASIDDYLERK